MEKNIFDGALVMLDIETTGLSLEKNHIIEIGAVKIVNGAIVDRFSTFVNPGEAIPEKIEQLTSITNKMVANAPLITEALPDFFRFCEGSVLAAYNAEFDMSFIKQKAKDQGIEIDTTYIDICAIAREALPKLKHFKLDDVTKTLGIPWENNYRSVDYAECSALIFLKLIRILKKQKNT